MKNNNIIKSISKVCLIMLISVISLFYINNYLPIFAEDKKQQQEQNATLASTDYNFIATGDWYCNEETKKDYK